MTTQPRDHTLAFLDAFYGRETVYDFRAMHDRDRSAPARTWRGTFAACEAELVAANAAGYGVHIVINEMGDQIKPDTGRISYTKSNVTACRAQLLDLDKPNTAGQQLQRLNASTIPPHILVHTSAGKVQCWFKVLPHTSQELHEGNQCRLFIEYDGDDQFTGIEHTARLPGFFHNKEHPQIVTVSKGPAWDAGPYDPWVIMGALMHVDITASPLVGRLPLGHESLKAPDLVWLERALWKIDPNRLSWREWIAVTAATKQAGWSHGPAEVLALWERWCSHYEKNDPAENRKQWQHIPDTASGWPKLRDMAGLKGDMMAAGLPIPSAGAVSVAPAVPVAQSIPIDPPAGPVRPGFAPNGYMLNETEQEVYFRGCFFISNLGRILTPEGVIMDQTKFNGRYGSVQFLFDGAKANKKPWESATNGQVSTIPKVHHTRFLPQHEYGFRTRDEFGREGVNTYRKPILKFTAGDVMPFINHVERLIADERDRRILYSFLAQCVQRPGVKIGWAVLIQSMEGAGKTIFKTILEAALGISYVHAPNTKELSDGGGKFNGWIRNRLMIICDEIRTDEKRVLVEVLKPLITEKRIEIQSKGQDQEMSDNPTNWLMFTNWKDAIPISRHSRRVAPIYSAIQSMDDLKRLGMTHNYFPDLYRWVDNGGANAVAGWLMDYAIEDEFDAQVNGSRAPETSSTADAIAESRGWLETLIVEAVARQDQGFRGGWVSSCALGKIVKANEQKLPGPTAIASAMRSLGYHRAGLAERPYLQENTQNNPYKATLYSLRERDNIAEYPISQGYGQDTPSTNGVLPFRQQSIGQKV